MLITDVMLSLSACNHLFLLEKKENKGKGSLWLLLT